MEQQILNWQDKFINKITCGDCFKLLPEVPDYSIDLVLTDPPYGVSLTPQRETSKFKGVEIRGDKDLSFLPALVSELYRVSKNVVYCFCNWQTWDQYYQAFSKRFTVKNCIVYDKLWFGIGWNWRPRHEFILLATKGTFKTKTHGMPNILRVKRLSSTKMRHPTQKPVELLEILIRESSNEGDIVLDPFIGAGSTALAAKNLNRKFIGMEIDNNYCKIAGERLSQSI